VVLFCELLFERKTCCDNTACGFYSSFILTFFCVLPKKKPCLFFHHIIMRSEHCLPDSRKTIKPVSVAGIAGGEKYICCGLFFKFCIDEHGLYGGTENAMKTASHELKGLQNYFHTNVEGLCVPLMAFIDYRGWRLMAVSLLPISSSKSTLCYGSDDAGRTVHNSNALMNEKMRQASRILNLKCHMVGSGEAKCELASAADIEGHLGKDSRFYLLDFARTAPPGIHIYMALNAGILCGCCNPL